MGKIYAWKKKELYRLPYDLDNRYYNLLKCAKWKDGYYLGHVRKSLGQIKAITVDIDIYIKESKHLDTPF